MLKHVMFACAVIGFSACTFRCDDEGPEKRASVEYHTEKKEIEVPDLDVDVHKDRTTIEVPDIDINKKETTIEHPDVDVDVNKKRTTIEVPDLDGDGPEE